MATVVLGKEEETCRGRSRRSSTTLILNAVLDRFRKKSVTDSMKYFLPVTVMQITDADCKNTYQYLKDLSFEGSFRDLKIVGRMHDARFVHDVRRD